MAKRDPIPEPDLSLLAKPADQFNANGLLLDWLSDDTMRAQVFDLINTTQNGQHAFWSRDTAPRDNPSLGPLIARTPPDPEHKAVLLITRRSEIETILQDNGSTYSNSAYAELGGGNFMLAIDATATAHGDQVKAYGACFPHSRPAIQQLAHLACQAAAITHLRSREFDLAAFAEQAALRFCQKLMGYAMGDYLRLEAAARAGYLALVYQVFGRHFTTDPTAIPAAKQATAPLLARTSALIEAYARNDSDTIKDGLDKPLPGGVKPVLQALAQAGGNLNGEQRANLALGTLVGTVGNVQAAACIVVQALFKNLQTSPPGKALLWQQADQLARTQDVTTDKPTIQTNHWQALIGPLLAANPPIPYLPRVARHGGKAAQEVLLALGGGTAGHSAHGDDNLIWGMLNTGGRHGCLGKELAWPLVVEIVRHVMSLPGLAEKLDPEDATPIGLKKRWGFNCESYPLTHQHDRRRVQSTLNVAMRLKSPAADSALRVREVIRAGAPRIEEALIAARHVHFAWFELIENDTVLVLHTVYDGPFEAYIQHFALKVSDMFTALFKYIEDPPPLPVDKYPNDFIAHLKRYNRAPAVGYLFSAYPRSEAAQIMRQEESRP